MNTNHNFPKTLLETVAYFSDKQTCFEYLTELHWPDGNVACPRCESTHAKLLATRQVWKCYSCNKQFSAKQGTIFEKSPLPLSKWLPCLYLITNCKNGVSSCEVARSIGVSQKTAWFMLHRLREAMASGTFRKLSGTVEADETFIGGSDKNRHASKKRRMNPLGPTDKTVVFGMIERGGEVTAKVVNSTKARDLKPEIRKHIEPDSILFTDNFSSYDGLHGEYYRDVVNHAYGEYVKGDTHTNTIESFWALLKRGLKGTYIHVEPFHLDRYIAEQSLRYGLRKGNDQNRFEQVAAQTIGRRLTYKELTGKATD